MYVVFFGKDRGGVRDAATVYIEANMPSDATLTTIEAADFAPGQVADALGAHSLFGGEQWFILDAPSANEEYKEAVLSVLPELAESENCFVILEGVLLAADKKFYNKHASTIEEFKGEAADSFNSFSLAEALAAKDKRRFWVLLQEARLAGQKEEALIGILWWQLKVLRLAARTNSAAEAGIKDFPYNKAKRALATFAPNEVERLAQSLLELYHDAHAGRCDIELALERWVLAI
jgi:DNA polymerase III delta subunit